MNLEHSYTELYESTILFFLIFFKKRTRNHR